YGLKVQDLDEEPEYEEIPGDECVLMPGNFCLATSVERIEVPNDLAGYIEGRSSIGRVGLFIQNAGYFDPGFRGQATLELYNASPNPLRIKAGRRICQFVFIQLTSPSENPYHGKYLDQEGATGSRIHQDREVSG
ncbi:MAG TPA: dCTP deaminase, partial [bacterium]|nr:dCTP deaminase [bacterium]